MSAENNGPIGPMCNCNTEGVFLDLAFGTREPSSMLAQKARRDPMGPFVVQWISNHHGGTISNSSTSNGYHGVSIAM